MTRAAAVLVCLTLVTGACTTKTAPAARRVGQVLAIAGVVGLVGTAATSRYIDGEDELMGGFSVMSGGGILTFAAGELSVPERGPRPETEPQKLRRWAKILTERAAGAAREGKCPRVRRLEKRVHVYDREVHDFVFMRDPEILRCLPATAPPPPPPTDDPLPSPAITAPAEPDEEPAPLPKLPHLP